MTTHADTIETTYEDDGLPLPPRPRRRLATPVTAGLAAVVVAALGFVGGVEVQRGQQTPAASTAGATQAGAFGFGARQGAAGGAGATGQAPAGLTIGTIASKRGKVLYVTDSNGKLVKVDTNASSKLTRTAATSGRGLYPGDTVVIQGKTAGNGTITATSVRATAKSAASAGGPGGFGGGGGGGFGGGAAPGAGAGSGG
jgi:hypothetical protein